MNALGHAAGYIAVPAKAVIEFNLNINRDY